MVDTNPPQERETTTFGTERNRQRLTELLKIAEQEFGRLAAARKFGREIEYALLHPDEDEDEGRSRRWAQWDEERHAHRYQL